MNIKNQLYLSFKFILFSLFALLSIMLLGCRYFNAKITTPFSGLKIIPVLIDSTLNIRALEIKNNTVYSAS